jgi:NAD(P)-dependent dehydrogenase (short-subunit alcohol dehydrogenase family)
VILADAVVVVTGGGSGIGAGLARRFVAEGARMVVVADIDLDSAASVSSDLGERARAVQLDVTDEAAVTELVRDVLDQHGPIDLFCSNAGIATGMGIEGGPAADRAWQRSWDIHVMAHVYAARAVIPSMIEAGGGHLLNTASAAGLLSSPGDAPYTATKHAAVAFAEWLAYQHARSGIKVSVLCPMGVDTPLLMNGLSHGVPAAKAVAASGDIITVEQVADAVVAGVTSDAFLILPHPQVGRFWAGKAADIDRWLAGTSELATESGAASSN